MKLITLELDRLPVDPCDAKKYEKVLDLLLQGKSYDYFVRSCGKTYFCDSMTDGK